MLLIWLMTAWMQSEHYYLDGVTFYLVDGTEIRTTATIRENMLEYTWTEGHVEINLPKRDVESMDYFSMRVPGRRPYKTYRNASQRRVSGRSVAYSRDQQTFLRVRHIDFRGRSAEGRSNASQVKELQIMAPDGERRAMRASFARVMGNSLLTFRFYDLKGNRLFEKVGRSEEIQAAKDGPTVFEFTVPASLDPEQVGLVEVITIPR